MCTLYLRTYSKVNKYTHERVQVSVFTLCICIVPYRLVINREIKDLKIRIQVGKICMSV